MGKRSDSFKEFLSLFWLNLVVTKRNLVEFSKVAWRYYWNVLFRKLDLALLRAYFFDNPFQISKNFLKNKGEENIYAYGETPLTTLEQIAKECHLNAQDTVFELGCGRGRNCFWLNAFVGCKAVGIEYVPKFVERANKIKQKYQVDGVAFRQENMLTANYSGATVLYLYGTCLAESDIAILVEQLSLLPAGTKIITVSYELNDFSEKNLFEMMKCFSATYTWGRAEVYLQIKK